MNNTTQRVAAIVTFVIAGASVRAAIAATGAGNAAGSSTPPILTRQIASISKGVGAPRFAWAVVRVTVSGRGNVEAMRLVYRSGDAVFSRMALQAVAKTTFVPDSHIGASSTFDYWLMSQNDKRSTRIIEHRHGDQNTSLVADVRVPPDGDAWLADVGDCESSHK